MSSLIWIIWSKSTFSTTLVIIHFVKHCFQHYGTYVFFGQEFWNYWQSGKILENSIGLHYTLIKSLICSEKDRNFQCHNVENESQIKTFSRIMTWNINYLGNEKEKKTESNEYSKIIKKKTEKGFLISEANINDQTLWPNTKLID